MTALDHRDLPRRGDGSLLPLTIGPARLLRQLVSQGLDPEALTAAAGLVVALDADAKARVQARQDREQQRRAAIAQARRGTRQPDAVRAKISATKRGRQLSPEHRARISAGMRGKAKTPEHVAAVRAARWGPAA